MFIYFDFQGERFVRDKHSPPLAGPFLRVLGLALLDRFPVGGVDVIRLLSESQSTRLLLAGVHCSTYREQRSEQILNQ